MTQLFREYFRAESILKKLTVVLSGTAIAQIISIATLPIISRLYDAEALGRYQLYITALNVLLMLVTLRYEVGLLSAKTRWVYNNLLTSVLRLCIFMSFITTVLLILVHPLIEKYNPALLEFKYFLVAGGLVGGIFNIFSFLPIRNREYWLSALAKIIQSFSYSFVGIVAALSPFGAIGLILADIGSRIFGASLIAVKSTRFDLSRVLKQRLSRFKVAAIRFKEFPTYTFPGTTLSAIAGLLPTMLLLNLFDLGVAGQVALVDRFILLPIGAIGYAVSQVFTGESSAVYRSNSKEVNKIFRKTVIILAMVAFFPCVAGGVLSSWAVPIIFGENWQLAGQICAISMLVVFTTFVASPVNMLLIVCGKQPVQLLWEIFRFALYLGAFVILWSIKPNNPLIVVSVFAVLSFVCYSAHLLLTDITTRRMCTA